MDGRFFAEEIKAAVKIPELLKFYGIEIGRDNRIACPFHNGNDKNCGVKDDYIHCFVCGESADAIGFVEKYFGVSFREAIAKINQDFSLGLPIGEKIDRRKQIEFARRRFEMKAKAERKNKEKERFKRAYEYALAEWARLDKNKRRYKPLGEWEAPHPLFVEAIKMLPHAEQRLNQAETELYLYEQRNRRDT